MVPVVTEVAKENRNTFAVARLNIGESPQTANKYQQLRAHPGYVVFQDGKEVGRFAGQKPKNTFVKNILDALN